MSHCTATDNDDEMDGNSSTEPVSDVAKEKVGLKRTREEGDEGAEGMADDACDAGDGGVKKRYRLSYVRVIDRDGDTTIVTEEMIRQRLEKTASRPDLPVLSSVDCKELAHLTFRGCVSYMTTSQLDDLTAQNAGEDVVVVIRRQPTDRHRASPGSRSGDFRRFQHARNQARLGP